MASEHSHSGSGGHSTASSTRHSGGNAETAGAKMMDDVETMKESFEKLRGDVMDLLGTAFGLGKHGAKYAKTAAKEGAETAVETMKEKLEDLRERGQDGIATLEQKIEDKPLQAALIAFGVGFIIAKILSRR